MGGAGVAWAGDRWGASRNPALVEELETGISVLGSQLFGLPELSREQAVGRVSFRSIAAAVQLGSFGSDLYRESSFGIIIGRRITNALSVGLEVDGNALQIEGQPSANCVAFSVGLLTEPARRVRIGAVWRNLNEPRLNGYRDRMAASLSVGLAAAVGSGGLVLADIVQDKHFRAEYRLGAELPVLPGLRLRVGARAEPVRPSAGFQVDTGRFVLSYGGDLHPDLGASHEVGLGIRFGP